MGGLVESSILPELASGAKQAGVSLYNGAGWLKDQFDQASPDAQKWIGAGIGLFAGMLAVNALLTGFDKFTGAAPGAGWQGSWSGMALKWGVALGAMALMSSDLNPWKSKMDGAEADPSSATDDPHSPWNDRDGDGLNDTTGEAMPERVAAAPAGPAAPGM